MRTQFAKLLKQLRKNDPDVDTKVVRKAYREADEAHKGQARFSGDPYVSHCIGVGTILTQAGLDATTVAAGLLHDVLEDTSMTREELEEKFGEEIAALVDGVSKIRALNMPASSATPESLKQKQADNLRKMLVATAKDVRVILIKLADRLHNMRTIQFLPEEKIQRISRETLDIYAPLAHRLGIARWKWELEDHAFHQLHPKEYKEMAKQVSMKRREREAWLKQTVTFLEKHLAEAEASARVIGRPKHLYSIYQKITEQGKDFDQVTDILAVRIITQTVAGCYNALGVVHHLWPPVPGRFKDYIPVPKVNMYQSIHTTVMRENGMPLEVQIRTEEMDRTAREGIASHWSYKEARSGRDVKLDGQLRWLQQMYGWLQDAHAPEELIDSVRRDVGSAEVYVFTPKGEVKELAHGGTPLDFAYMIHSEIGHRCIGARVNNRMVPLRYHLQTGDVVEILTSKNQTPHRDWLDIVVTGKARARIRQRMRELGMMERIKEPEPKGPTPPKSQPRPESKADVRQVDDATRKKLILVQGHKGIDVQFAKCCKPMPGHAVIGYITKTPGLTIHRADCNHLAATKRDPARMVEAYWDGELGGGKTREVVVRVAVGRRPNVLADITNAIRPMNISITRAVYRADEDGKNCFDFVFEASGQDSADRVIATIRTVSGVAAVNQLPSGSY